MEQFVSTFALGRVTEVRAKSRTRYTKRQVWQWSIAGTKAQIVLAFLMPYLREKKPQAIEAMRYHIGHKGRSLSDGEKNQRHEIATNLKLLKKEAI